MVLIKTKMKVKLAAKMLVIAWTLMKKKEPFDPLFLDIRQESPFTNVETIKDLGRDNTGSLVKIP